MTTHSLSVDDPDGDSDKKEEINKFIFCFYLDSSFVAEVTLIFRE